MRRTFGICFLVLLSAFCLWKYAERLTPMERLHSGNFSLEQLQREKCVIITDLCEIKKAELWEDFIKKVKHASDAKVRVLFVYSGEKEGSTLCKNAQASQNDCLCVFLNWIELSFLPIE